MDINQSHCCYIHNYRVNSGTTWSINSKLKIPVIKACWQLQKSTLHLFFSATLSHNPHQACCSSWPCQWYTAFGHTLITQLAHCPHHSFLSSFVTCIWSDNRRYYYKLKVSAPYSHSSRVAGVTFHSSKIVKQS